MKKYTTESFIEEARKIHGDRYDYSKTEYIRNKEKIEIICRKHGPFKMLPYLHLNGCNCPKCMFEQNSQKRKKTTEQFIEEAKAIHGDKYDYSKTVYKSGHEKTCIICHEKDPKTGEEHGEFWMTPSNHLRGQNCPKCGRFSTVMSRAMTTEKFIEEARKKHGDKYDYSLVDYKTHEKVDIICHEIDPITGEEHGVFSQDAFSHLSGCECPKCKGKEKMTTERFIKLAKAIYGEGKYDYSETVYNGRKRIKIICHEIDPITGEEHGAFYTDVYYFLGGKGCPKCRKVEKEKTTEQFIEEAKAIHGDKYDYSETVYRDAKTKVTVICPDHGPFEITPPKHLKGKGCPICEKNRKQIKNKVYKTPLFIKKAEAVHGDKYDYSHTVYANNHTNIRIGCPSHGFVDVNPVYHLKSCGCPECGKKLGVKKQTGTLEQFIEKARGKHGDKYDYSQVVYVNSNTKVKIICPEHGVFEQVPHSHLRGCGCPECGNGLRVKKQTATLEQFIEKVKKVHGDKYDYSLVKYVNTNTKVDIICPEHGVFRQKPCEHIGGHGCPKCAGIIRLTTEDFIRKARAVHGDKYDYSLVDYVNYATKVKIICPEHGIFLQTPGEHLSGQGCSECKLKKLHDRFVDTKEDFIRKAEARYGVERYDYSIVDYFNSKTKVNIICHEIDPKTGLEHGVFCQAPHNFLNGFACPICALNNPSEKKLYNYIKKTFGDAIYQYRVDFLKRQSLDIYIPSINVGIEYQGLQHFEPVGNYGGEECFKDTVERDQRKYRLCIENGVDILYYTNDRRCINREYFTKLYTDKEELIDYLINKRYKKESS